MFAILFLNTSQQKSPFEIAGLLLYFKCTFGLAEFVVTKLPYKFLILLRPGHKNKLFENTVEILNLIDYFHPLILAFKISMLRCKPRFNSIPILLVLKLDLIQLRFPDHNRMRSRIVLDLAQNLRKNFSVEFVFVFSLGFCI